MSYESAVATLETAPTLVRNELFRYAVQLPDTGERHRVDMLLIALDELPDGSREYTVIRQEGTFGFRDAGRQIPNLCYTRALETIDENVLVLGTPILPEQYLSRWRKTIDGPISLDDFIRKTGHTPVCVLRDSLSAIAESETYRWQGGKMSFKELRQEFGKWIEIDEQEDRFTMTVPIVGVEEVRAAQMILALARPPRSEPTHTAEVYCLDLREEI